MEKAMLYAYEVYRQRSFSRAAEELYVSQPALSTIIRKLEESLDATLFDRSTKPVSLTPEGLHYIACAEEIMAVETGMKQYFEDVRNLRRGTVRIGASTYFCSSILPELLHAFQEAYPYLKPSIVEDNSTPRLQERLLSREIDFALTSNTYPGEFEACPLADESIILAVPAGSPANAEWKACAHTWQEITDALREGADLAGRFPGVPVSAFAKEKFITIDRISDLYPRILNMFKPYGIVPEIAMHLQQMSSCYYMAANGFGSAFLRAATLLTVRETKTLCFYCIDSPLALRPTRLYSKRGGYVSHAMQAFLDWLFLLMSILPWHRPSLFPRQEAHGTCT